MHEVVQGFGSDRGSDRIGDLGKKPDPNWSLAQKRLGKKEGHVGDRIDLGTKGSDRNLTLGRTGKREGHADQMAKEGSDRST